MLMLKKLKQILCENLTQNALYFCLPRFCRCAQRDRVAASSLPVIRSGAGKTRITLLKSKDMPLLSTHYAFKQLMIYIGCLNSRLKQSLLRVYIRIPHGKG